MRLISGNSDVLFNAEDYPYTSFPMRGFLEQGVHMEDRSRSCVCVESNKNYLYT